MKLRCGEGEEFETFISDGMFVLKITQESELSLDGGHSFEDVTNSFEIGREKAVELIGELKDYLNMLGEKER